MRIRGHPPQRKSDHLDEVLGHDVSADRADSIGRRIRGALEVLLPLGDVSGLDGLRTV